MAFSPNGATSIDLCVKELLENSEYKSATTIIRTEGVEPFPGFNVISVPRTGFGYRVNALQVFRRLIRINPDIIVVEQHLPTAYWLSQLSRKPVIFHGHNYQKVGKSRFANWKRQRSFAALAGVVLVSEACKADFRKTFRRPERVAAIPNGLRMVDWNVPAMKENQIVVIGRCSPEKGIYEAAQALAHIMPRYPTWTASFILSETGVWKSYFQEVQAALAGVPRVTIQTDQPYAAVCEAYRHAAVALVLSKVDEGFGRTALEALASSCALITSGKGGLREVAGEHALYVDPTDLPAVVEAIDQVISNKEARDSLAYGGKKRVATLFDISRVSRDFFSFLTETHSPSAGHNL